MEGLNTSTHIGTIVGKLKEKLVLETDDTVYVIPKGCIIEVSSEDAYPHENTVDDIEDAAEYLNSV